MAQERRKQLRRFDETRASVAAVVFRETDGNDELEAARMARSRQALTEQEAGAHLLDELIRISIYAVQPVGGTKPQRVAQPYQGYSSWNSYTRQLALIAFNELNDVSRAELEAFRTGASDWTDPTEESPEAPPSGEYEKPRRGAAGGSSTRSSSPAGH